MTTSTETLSSGETVACSAGRLLSRIREERPRVHCLTNPVAMNLSANLLLAAGAVPSMTFDPEVQADFIGTSRALVVNLGMLEPVRLAAIRTAIGEAQRLGRPWVLDPVKVERSPARLAIAHGLIGQAPAALRGNRDEVRALTDGLPRGQRLTVVTTGEIDEIRDGSRSLRLGNGSALMDRVTAMGCAATALSGAFLAVEPDPFVAMAAAILVMGVAGEIAEGLAHGPGSFVPAFLDAVYALDTDRLAALARLA